MPIVTIPDFETRPDIKQSDVESAKRYFATYGIWAHRRDLGGIAMSSQPPYQHWVPGQLEGEYCYFIDLTAPSVSVYDWLQSEWAGIIRNPAQVSFLTERIEVFEPEELLLPGLRVERVVNQRMWMSFRFGEQSSPSKNPPFVLPPDSMCFLEGGRVVAGTLQELQADPRWRVERKLYRPGIEQKPVVVQGYTAQAVEDMLGKTLIPSNRTKLAALLNDDSLTAEKRVEEFRR